MKMWAGFGFLMNSLMVKLTNLVISDLDLFIKIIMIYCHKCLFSFLFLFITLSEYGQTLDSGLSSGVKGVVFSENKKVTHGELYRAHVFFAKKNSEKPLEFRLGNEGVKRDSVSKNLMGEYSVLEVDPLTGMGIIEIQNKTLGDQERQGVIIYRSLDNQEHSVEFDVNYRVVAQEFLAIPSKMNILYKGVSNPVDISIHGVYHDEIEVHISNGTIRKSSQGYTVQVEKGNTTKISCLVKMPDGRQKMMGPKEFRIKRLPNPTPSFGSKTSSDSTIPKSTLVRAKGIRAVMENFDFDVKIVVTSFDMSFLSGIDKTKYSSPSNRITSEMLVSMNNSKKGDYIFIENIIAQLPNGETRKLANITLKVV